MNGTIIHMSKQEEYLDKLPQLLLDYQFIEECLKMYIWRADVIIHLAAKAKIYYRGFDTKKLAKLPLGRLTEEFRKRTDRDDLLDLLKKIGDERNFFAHQGYLLTHEEHKKEHEALQLLSKLDEAKNRSKSFLKELIAETCKVSDETVPEIIKEMH